jgi:hypothetical protein
LNPPINKKFGFKLRQTIATGVQKAIVDNMRTSGVSHPLIHGPDQPSCMKLLHIRTFDVNHPAAYQQEAPSVNSFDSHDYDDYVYINRMNPDVDWFWIDNPITALVQPEVAKLEELYEYITRVTVLVTDVNAAVPFHREWMYGNNYDNRPILPQNYFQRKNLVLTDFEDSIDGNAHRNQKYYACKIPITEKEGNNGNSYFKFDDGTLVKYGAGNHMFCINEIEMSHGALPTPFLRGVIYIDGKIKLDKLIAQFSCEFEEM